MRVRPFTRSSDVYRKRGPWLNLKMSTFFLTGGIMAGYQNSSVVLMSKNFNGVESLAKSLYQSWLHQNNDNRQDGSLPLFVTLFF